MPPAILLLRIGTGPLYLPLPVLLLWPLLAVAYLLVLPVLVLTRGRALRWRPLQGLFTFLEMFRHLRGLHVDVRSRDGSFYMRFL